MITVLREELGDLPPSDRRLILVLAENPRVPYTGINARLGVPFGSIGPPATAAGQSCAATQPLPP